MPANPYLGTRKQQNISNIIYISITFLPAHNLTRIWRVLQSGLPGSLSSSSLWQPPSSSPPQPDAPLLTCWEYPRSRRWTLPGKDQMSRWIMLMTCWPPSWPQLARGVWRRRKMSEYQYWAVGMLCPVLILMGVYRIVGTTIIYPQTTILLRSLFWPLNLRSNPAIQNRLYSSLFVMSIS